MTNAFFKSVVIAGSLSLASLTFASSDLSRALTPQLSVTGNMTAEKFKDLMQDDFKAVIVNRPDEEPGNHVSVQLLRSIAEKSHVSVIYQPVISGQIKQSDVQEFAKYYNELPKPILMVCRSGSRSAQLFNQAQQQGLLDE